MSTTLTVAEIGAWRKARRSELIAERLAIPTDRLERMRLAIDTHIQRAFPQAVHGVVAFCWPYKNEYDARHLLADWRRHGAVTAMPAIVAPRTPLIFREWHPGVALDHGPLGIPFPRDSAELPPDTVLLPVVGFDRQGYRLGYGGGYFDRTLGALREKAGSAAANKPAANRPLVIGVGHEFALLDTIYPQPYDMPLDYMVTERGVYQRLPEDGGRLRFLEQQGYSSPACLAGDIAPGYFGEAAPGSR